MRRRRPTMSLHHRRPIGPNVPSLTQAAPINQSTRKNTRQTAPKTKSTEAGPDRPQTHPTYTLSRLFCLFM